MRTLILMMALSVSACTYAEDVAFIGGQLRQVQEDPTKWCWIVNKSHTTIGVDNTLCGIASGNKITLPYGVDYTKVITFNGYPDDDYVTNLDMNIGVSKGLSHSVLYITSFGQPIDVDVWLGYSYGNIEINGIMVK